MMILSLDTATRSSGLALFDGTRIVAELNWYSAESQTIELMPRVTQLMAWHQVQPADLAALAVSLGPGSFTGLRIALSVAKGMALAAGLPVVGVPTLDVTALPHLPRCEPVCALAQAGRGRIFWAQYAATPDLLGGPAEELPTPVDLGSWAGWRTPYHLSDVAGLAARVPQPTLFVGEVSPPMADELIAALGDRALVMSPAAATRRAAALASLGFARWQAGTMDEVATLSPIYLREP